MQICLPVRIWTLQWNTWSAIGTFPITLVERILLMQPVVMMCLLFRPRSGGGFLSLDILIVSRGLLIGR